MKIFHIALESDWVRAADAGEYTTSTLGRSLAEEGFIHAARADQVATVSRTYYGTVRRPLLRLEIDTDKLAPTWREDPVGGDTYPHIYGPLNLSAVTDVRPWHRSGRELQLVEVFLGEALHRILLAILVMLLAVLGASVAGHYGDTARLVGALAGLALGVVLFWLAMRRRSRRRLGR